MPLPLLHWRKFPAHLGLLFKFKFLLNFTTTKNTLVTSEICSRIHKCQVLCVRESPTGTTLSVYSLQL